ncbi:MAG: type II secretion system F family protein [Pseudomonadota bacterium]|nr:type II secretion system F family protein [Pseudomonadota bacterium]
MSSSTLKTFSFTGTNRKGASVKGDIEAGNIQLAQAKLRKQGVIADRIKPKSNPLFVKGVRDKDVTFFTRQLGTMLKSGIPITQALEITAEGQKNPAFKNQILQIKRDIESGLSLHEALRRHPKQFDDLYRSLVESGELSGNLEGMLGRIAEYKEKILSIKSKIKKAAYYPVFVLLFAFSITLFLMLKVVPQFVDMFEQQGADLPTITKVVTTMSEWLQDWWIIMLLVIVGTVIGFFQLLKRSKSFQQQMDVFLLKLPLFGSLIKRSILARFARTLSTSFSSGVPMVECLDSCAKAANNYVYTNAILKIKEDVASGQELAFAMKQTGVFTPLMIQMTNIGEESGAIDDMEDKAADYYEQEVDDTVEGLLSLIEPAMMILLGGIITVILLAIYLPIFDIGSLVG